MNQPREFWLLQNRLAQLKEELYSVEAEEQKREWRIVRLLRWILHGLWCRGLFLLRPRFYISPRAYVDPDPDKEYPLTCETCGYAKWVAAVDIQEWSVEQIRKDYQ